MGRQQRMRRHSVTLEAEIELDAILEELHDDEIEREMRRRGIPDASKTAVQTAIAQIRRGDTLDAITTLEREFWPKWATVADSEAALRAANDNREAAVAVSVGG